MSDIWTLKGDTNLLRDADVNGRDHSYQTIDLKIVEELRIQSS